MMQFLERLATRIRDYWHTSTPPTLTAKRPDMPWGVDVPEGIRRPERFYVVKPEMTFTGTIVAIKKETDGDKHHRLLVDPECGNLINENNTKIQKGCLVFEIEPWQRGEVSKALGSEKVNGRKPSTYPTTFKVGDRVEITAPILLDSEHNWHEAHAPKMVRMLPRSSEKAQLLNFADYAYGDGKDEVEG